MEIGQCWDGGRAQSSRGIDTNPIRGQNNSMYNMPVHTFAISPNTPLTQQRSLISTPPYKPTNPPSRAFQIQPRCSTYSSAPATQQICCKPRRDRIDRHPQFIRGMTVVDHKAWGRRGSDRDRARGPEFLHSGDDHGSDRRWRWDGGAELHASDVGADEVGEEGNGDEDHFGEEQF